MLKKGTPASPATARASSVLPVPGGPTSSTPRGMRAPSELNFSGYFRNSTTSVSSCLASSTPATSVKVTTVLLPRNMRARLLPKLMAWLLVPCAWRIMKKMKAPMSSTGSSARDQQPDPLAGGAGLDRVEGDVLAQVAVLSYPAALQIWSKIAVPCEPGGTMAVCVSVDAVELHDQPIAVHGDLLDLALLRIGQHLAVGVRGLVARRPACRSRAAQARTRQGRRAGRCCGRVCCSRLVSLWPPCDGRLTAVVPGSRRPPAPCRPGKYRWAAVRPTNARPVPLSADLPIHQYAAGCGTAHPIRIVRSADRCLAAVPQLDRQPAARPLGSLQQRFDALGGWRAARRSPGAGRDGRALAAVARASRSRPHGSAAACSSVGGQPVEQRVVVRGEAREARDRLDRAADESLQHRQHLRRTRLRRKAGSAFDGSSRYAIPAASSSVAQDGAAFAEQRPDDPPAPGGNAARPAEPACRAEG